ncbi:MAG: hypothetical protein QOI58_938 [Thermoanaerobaculia bacterium]|jgi:uncharacterized protein with HEPN domain|nr:hypothetical protein [Thermoanaerobaculia bacterium]
MLDTCYRVMATTAKITRADFDADETFQFALTHLLQTIGRSAERVSDAARREHPEIDWPNVIDLQNRVVRDNRKIVFDVVWRAANGEVQQLLTALEAFMPSDPP